MAGLVCGYMSIDWIPAFAGMTVYVRPPSIALRGTGGNDEAVNVVVWFRF